MKKTVQAPSPTPTKENKSSGSDALGPKYAMIGTIVAALLTLVGIVIVQWNSREIITLPIALTQTAEAKTATALPAKLTLTPTISPSATPSTLPSPSAVTPAAGACSDDMVLVRQGYFWMGAAPGDTDAQDDEKPGKRIELDAFCIDRTEVSNQDYANFIRATSHRPPPPAPGPDLNTWKGDTYIESAAKLPVVRVSWTDADAYCRWRGRVLPTETQWEKAARGSDARLYPWGDKWDPSLTNWGGTGANTVMPVDAYPGGRSEYGALNMGGNVSEWTADWYQSDWYKFMLDKNPTGPSIGIERVIRGGSFMDANSLLRTSARQSFAPEPPALLIVNFIGFRCAKESKP